MSASSLEISEDCEPNFLWIPTERESIDLTRSRIMKRLIIKDTSDTSDTSNTSDTSDTSDTSNTSNTSNTSDTSDTSNTPRKIIINFISGQELIIIHHNELLIELKEWLIFHIFGENDCMCEEYVIEFVINDQVIHNTIGITLDNINKITCIIKKTHIEHRMIGAECTNECHRFKNSQLYNIDQMGNICDNGCGILMPEGLNPFDLPENIPSEYKNVYTDIDWIKFKKTIKTVLENYKKYHGKWDRQDDEDHGFNDYYEQQCEWEWKLTNEQMNQRKYSRLYLCCRKCSLENDPYCKACS
jgi:hypothetical protein